MRHTARCRWYHNEQFVDAVVVVVPPARAQVGPEEEQKVLRYGERVLGSRPAGVPPTAQQQQQQ
jgi:hypothetical protein